MNIRYRYLIFLYGLVLTTCAVDPPFTECGLPEGIIYDQEIFPVDKINRKNICSNPLNEKEFLYTAFIDNEFELWKYNLQDSSTELIANVNVDFKPDWSVTGWIVFTQANQIFKCKSNGDSLTQLTFGEKNYYPTWSPDGHQIIFERNYSDTIATGLVTIDKDGIVLEEVKSTLFAGSSYTWSPDGSKVAFWSSSNVYNRNLLAWFYKVSPETLYFLDKSIPKEETVDAYMQWYPNSQTILWASGSSGSLYKTDISTQSTDMVKYGCEYNYYDFCITSIGDIISRREELTFIPSLDEDVAAMGFGTVYVDYDLVKINSEGSELIIPY